MSQVHKSVCIISGGLESRNLRLQPWRYFHETARQLISCGHRVTLITDSSDHSDSEGCLEGVPVIRVPSVRRVYGQPNHALEQAVASSKPEVILWHLGVTSFAYQQFGGWPEVPVIGVFPGLIYYPRELLQLGLKRITRNLDLSAIHLLGLLVPRWTFKRVYRRRYLNSMVVQTQTTAQRLERIGLPNDWIKVISPGVDENWRSSDRNWGAGFRTQLGYSEEDTVFVYFGSPAPLRGLHTLIKAFNTARKQDSSLKLLILSRRRKDELVRVDGELRRLLNDENLEDHTCIVSGFLDQETLIQYVAASDAVALPFELVPADAPLSVLEAQALGKPVIVTDVASLPEISSSGTRYLAKPADHHSLAQALLQVSEEKQRVRDQKKSPEQQLPYSTIHRSWTQVGKEWSQLIQSL